MDEVNHPAPFFARPCAGFVGANTNNGAIMHKNKYHRDGTVTYWDVYQQRWMRLHAMLIKDRILATMNDAMRERIARHAEKHPFQGWA